MSAVDEDFMDCIWHFAPTIQLHVQVSRLTTEVLKFFHVDAFSTIQRLLNRFKLPDERGIYPGESGRKPAEPRMDFLELT